MPKIHLPQKNLVIDVASGANLMNALLTAGVPVASSCLGDGICGKCRMHLSGPHITAANILETETLSRNAAKDGERLSCQITVICDLEVKTTYW